jgi:transposase, IS605 OrfB family, central region
METTQRTLVTHPRNHQQVKRQVDPHAWDASKLWNVGLYHLYEWLNNDNLPAGDLDHALKEQLKTHDKYNGLHSQSSQQVLEELATAFSNWLSSNDTRDSPPGYRKENYYDQDGNRVHEEHPRSTVTWKQSAIRHDEQNHRLRLSKGANHKSSPRACEYILVNYNTPDYTDIGDITQVRAVWNGDKYEIHIVHEVEIPDDSPGERVAGVDLGICVPAAVAYPDEAAIYPGNTLHEDRHYFSREEYQTEGPNGPSTRAERARETLSRRTDDFRHKLSHEIAETCVEKNVGQVIIGDPSGVEDDDWGRHGNKRLQNWAFSKLAGLIEYKCRERGIEVELVDERGTSSSCSRCGHEADACRVERGLWECSSCGVVMHGDVNGADNIRQKSISAIPPLAETVDSANGCVAQPVVYLFDRTRGFQPRHSEGSCKPNHSNSVSSSPNNATRETGSPPL